MIIAGIAPGNLQFSVLVFYTQFTWSAVGVGRHFLSSIGYQPNFILVRHFALATVYL